MRPLLWCAGADLLVPSPTDALVDDGDQPDERPIITLKRKSCKLYMSYFYGEEIKLAEVRLQEGEPLENALRRFKRKVQAEDIIKDVKRHSYYLKPGERKRVKQAQARKRARKKSRADRSARSDRD